VRSANHVRVMWMNVAAAPFDDIHVRRALAWVVDKRSYIRARGGALTLSPFGHIAPDALVGGLLRGYDPLGTPGARGSVARARAEMRRSRYDRDRDGRCNAAACREIAALNSVVSREGGESLRRDAAKIGLELHLLRPRGFAAFNRLYTSPHLHVALGMGSGVVGILGDPWDLFNALSSGDIGSLDFSLLGASPRQLDAWGYRVRRVPSIDARLARCRPLVGQAGIACAARLDQYLMQRVVPGVPLVDEQTVQVIPRRVVAYSYDQANQMPAFDRIAVARTG
jgi:hypothetical protein